MSGEFRGSAVTTGYVSSSAGQPYPVGMPADIQAGDILVVAGGQVNLAIFDHAVAPVAPATGWFAVNGPRNIFMKIADGTEGGTTSSEFLTLDTTSQGPGPRSAITAAFCYRFSVAPQTNGTTGPNNYAHPSNQRVYGDAGSTDSSAHGGRYPGFVNTPAEFRFYLNQAQGDSFTVPSVPASMTWSGDLLTDRTGLYTEAAGGSTIDAQGVSFADAFYLTDVANNDPHTKVVTTGAGFVGAFLNGFSLFFAAVPSVYPYWGILATPA